MKFDFRLLTIITIITTVISLLAFTGVPPAKEAETSSVRKDTTSPYFANELVSPNVQPGEQVFSFYDSAINYHIYLPEEYSFTQNRYPVIYLLNGPAFYPAAGSDEDWRIDELLDSLTGAGRQKALLVALSGLPELITDHDSLARFMSRSVKPFVDENYRTQPLNTVVAGTGQYADAALLTALLYKQQFPKAGVFSPTDSVNHRIKTFGLNGSGFSGRVFIYKNGSKQAGVLADNLAANSSALLYTQNKQHTRRQKTPFGGWFTEFYCWMMGNGFNYIINTKN